jgi:hypothetical protein
VRGSKLTTSERSKLDTVHQKDGRTGSATVSWTQIDLLAQHTGTLEGDHFAGSQHDRIAGLWIAAAPLVLFLHAEFPKSADEHILTLFQGLLNNFEKSLNDLGGFTLGKNVLCKQAFHDVSFGQRRRHGSFLSFFLDDPCPRKGDGVGLAFAKQDRMFGPVLRTFLRIKDNYLFYNKKKKFTDSVDEQNAMFAVAKPRSFPPAALGSELQELDIAGSAVSGDRSPICCQLLA